MSEWYQKLKVHHMSSHADLSHFHLVEGKRLEAAIGHLLKDERRYPQVKRGDFFNFQKKRSPRRTWQQANLNVILSRMS